MANTDVVVASGSMEVNAKDILAGEGARIIGDTTTEFTRKDRLRDVGDATTLTRRALDKAWRLAHSPRDVTTVYRQSV